MALLSVANLVYAIGEHRILDGVNLTLAPDEHVGLVGRNGCGKSTLLKLIAGIGEGKPQDGQIQIGRGTTVGYLTQDHDLQPGLTLREEAGEAFSDLARLHRKLDKLTEKMATASGDDLEKLLKQYERAEHEMEAAGGYAVDHRIDEMLHGLGLADEFFGVKVADLSGGQKGRLSLAKLLLSEPDLLLLDEPTNHLDIAGRQWLEQFLQSYRGAVIIISHDRWLLDHAVSTIYELERGEMVRYPGNYEKFRELREQRRLEQQRVYENQQTKIRHEQGFIDRYRSGQRAKQARGREKRLERFKRDELVEAPVSLDAMKLKFRPTTHTGDMVISAENIAKRYEELKLFEKFSISIKRGERIGIIGPNGAGKSTLIKCMTGELEPDTGSSRIGAQTSVGHYKQTHEHLDLSQTVVQYLQRLVESNTEQEARDLAGAFLFSGLDQDKPLGVLSGGERSRAVIAGLMCRGHNLLVLDEPTNHLDIPSCERLEEALKQYTQPAKGFGNSRVGGGTLILISHDRMLLEHLVDQLLIFDGHGDLKHMYGSYSDYLRTVQTDANASKPVTESESTPLKKTEKKAAADHAKPNKPSAESKDRKRNKKHNSPAAKFSLKKLEARIEEIETTLERIDFDLASPAVYADGEKVKALKAERESLKAELGPLEEEWMQRAGA